MPTFRLKNLNVSLADRADLVAQRTPQFCTLGTTTIWSPFCCRFWPSRFPPTGCWNYPTIIDCGHFISEHCGPLTPDPCGPISPVVADTPDLVGNPAVQLEQLDVLRAQLEQAMAAVDERGVQLQKQARPQTREEIDMLEEQLKAALEELQAMRKEMG